MRCALAVLLLALGLSLASGCGSKTGPAATADDPQLREAAEKLPDGTNVLAALQQKDYEAAVANLIKIQQGLTDPQQSEFLVLKQHVKSLLIDVSTTDPKAAEALNGLRFATQGR
jgi:hypothetical protein